MKSRIRCVIRLTITGFVLTLIACTDSGTSVIDTDPIQGTGWEFEVVASGYEVGLHSSLTITSDGTVFVAYHDHQNMSLHCARRTDTGSWEHTRVDTLGWMGMYVTIRAGEDDTLHMAYQDVHLKDLRYSRYDGESWVSELIEASSDVGGFAPALIPRHDGVHIIEQVMEPAPHLKYWQGSPYHWTLIDTFHVRHLRSNERYVSPLFSFDYGPNGPVLAYSYPRLAYYPNWQEEETVYTPSVWTASHPTGPWVTLFHHEVSDAHWNVYWGDGAVAVDSGGSCHALFFYSYREWYNLPWVYSLKDFPDERNVDTEIVDDPILVRKNSGAGLWALYAVQSGLAISQYVGDSWERIASIDGFDPGLREQWDMHVDDQEVVHVSLYNRHTRELLYGRWSLLP